MKLEDFKLGRIYQYNDINVKQIYDRAGIQNTMIINQLQNMDQFLLLNNPPKLGTFKSCYDFHILGCTREFEGWIGLFSNEFGYLIEITE